MRQYLMRQYSMRQGLEVAELRQRGSLRAVKFRREVRQSACAQALFAPG